MTKKDYELIAEVMQRTDAPASICNELAKRLYEDNDRFNKHRFLILCGFVPREPQESPCEHKVTIARFQYGKLVGYECSNPDCRTMLSKYHYQTNTEI